MVREGVVGCCGLYLGEVPMEYTISLHTRPPPVFDVQTLKHHS